MKFLRKSFALIMALVIISSVFTVMPLTSGASTVNQTSVSATATKIGKCGKSVKWKFSKGVLTIYGKGKMTKEIDENITSKTKELVVKNGVTDVYLLNLTLPSLKKVTLGKGIKSIGNFLFGGCEKLTTVKFSNNLKIIDSNAFEGCSSLTSITIPNNVKKVGVDAFDGCTKLRSINVSKNNKTYTSINGVLFTKSKKTLVIYPNGKKNTFYKVPNGTYKIAEKAFYYNLNLKSVTMTNLVRIIGDYAFAYCDNLNKVQLSQGLTDIGEQILTETKFENNKSNWKNGVLYCGNALISTNQDLKEVNVKKGTRIIGTYGIYLCEKLEKVTLPEGLLYINDMALLDNEKLSELTVPKSVKVIGDKAIGLYDELKWNGGFTYKHVQPFNMNVYKNSVGYKYAKNYKLNYTVIDE